MLNDYVRIPYANGSSFASQFLHRELTARGREVTVVGPEDPEATAADLPPRHLLLPSLPLHNHPGVRLALPSPDSLEEAASRRFDLTLGQTTSELLALGVWLRLQHDVPLLCVNTVHLPSVYNVVIPDWLHGVDAVHEVFRSGLVPFLERHSVELYDRSDGLIVLSRGLGEYWARQGVTAPIHVIPRSVEPRIFDAAPGDDPFDPRAPRGMRLLCVCRHVREKGVRRLIDLFARWIAPASPRATLTLVGDGPDHDTFRAYAAEKGVAERVFFPGEQALTSMSTWYRWADLFVYASLSETYGQVVSEALWCGLPVVAFDDGMGVTEQLSDGGGGMLIGRGPDEDLASWHFASAVVGLLHQPSRRGTLARTAERVARLRSDPDRCVQRYLDAFAAAKAHGAQTAEARARMRRDDEPARILSRWRLVHSAVYALGHLRPPATLNRNQRRAPAWTDLPELPRLEAAAS